ncbi:hypothetical protein K2173_022654 [Erythroxylum novogranatense]|uniref:Glycoside hydrolase family 5 domain-containing protein n=1 Tax=Erythroxylum novogranatense TaxID=1862640 RepID=A0AAV8TNJ6_9ROSI|nr:hypothetical protein K2173_022654 [Erythroxylum novogranatense]
MPGKALHAIFLLSCLLYSVPGNALPLSTNNRWIVDAKTGERVKLHCVNWPSHVGAMLAEGLHKKPLDYILSQVVNNQFNCVRFTWATYMFTRPEMGNLKVQQSFDMLNLSDAKEGVAKNNPSLLNKTLLEAFDTIVDAMGQKGLLVLLDNHVSMPIWCCSDNDGNGFFGDTYFEAQEWINSLITVAQRYKGKSQVIGIGTRNEMRGPQQNETLWYKYITEAANKIHEVNPDVLVVASGLNYATDLSFLKAKPLGFNLNNKLVLEAHSYAWSTGDGNSWLNQPLNEVCAQKIQLIDGKFGFLNNGENAVPIFIGEFGLNQQNVSSLEDYYLSCLLAYITEKDLDWGLWGLQGDYYFRDNKTYHEETFGLLDVNWNLLRNPKLQERLRLVKTELQVPSTNSSSSYVIYHPQTGSCVQTNDKNEFYASECGNFSRWTHDKDDSPIKLVGVNLCLQVTGEGLAPILSTTCSGPQSTWRSVSSSKLHLAAKNQNGEDLCLELDSSNPTKIVTNKCICVAGDPNCKENPTSQWFKLASVNVN